jgi:Skp family chaperone for outer membrane proteins
MRISKTALVAAAVVAVGFAVWTELRGQPAAPAAPLNPQGPIAVLDAEEIMLNYQRATDLRRELETRRLALVAEDNKRKDQIVAIEASLSQLMPDSADFDKQVNEMRRLSIDRAAALQFETSLLEAKHHRLLSVLYEDITKMAGIVANQMGYRVVLDWNHQMPRTKNSEELTAVMRDRKVLYADNSVDITEAVLKRLNDAHRATTRP